MEKRILRGSDIIEEDGNFDSSSPYVIGFIPHEGNDLLFYFVDFPFTLYVALVENKEPKKILWGRDAPLWQTSEKIKPVVITRTEDLITFYFLADGKAERLQFFLKDILVDRNEDCPSAPLVRSPYNPIIEPRSNVPWDSQYVFNPAALYLDGKVHIIYRAIGHSGLSVLGYAASRDAIHIDERSSEPAYVCDGPLQCQKADPAFSSWHYSSGGSWSGCEDPRLVKIEDTIYMTYTAFGGWGTPPGVALTSISVKDFLKKHWSWKKPILISPPNEMHKNWVLFPEKIHGKYALLHSLSPKIIIDYFDDLDFNDNQDVKSHYHSGGREDYWDNWMRGVGPPPIKTNEGWLLLYHAMDKNDPNKYKVGAMILDSEDPTRILYRSDFPLLEPTTHYENEGFKAGVVYVCGAVVKDGVLFIYYGGADTVVCVASANLNALLTEIKKSTSPTISENFVTETL